MGEMRINDADGNRLYLKQKEVAAFLKEAKEANVKIRTFAETLAYTGCRISEALEITHRDIQRDALQVTINSLKKRRGDIYRNIPVPEPYMNTLVVAHTIVEKQRNVLKAKTKLWPWTRQHGYNVIKKLMVQTNIAEGNHRTPKGLRHAYGVNAISKDIPLNMLQKWMGHADISTPAIYANAIGMEEAQIANKMWDNLN